MTLLTSVFLDATRKKDDDGENNFKRCFIVEGKAIRRALVDSRAGNMKHHTVFLQIFVAETIAFQFYVCVEWGVQQK